MNFFVSLLMNGSMMQLFGMIRALQVIVFSILIRAPLSGISFEFFNVCMLFAQADVFDGSGLYSEWFEFRETESPNQNYLLLGIDSSNFIINSGSFFILMTQIVCFGVIKQIWNAMATRCPKNRWIRIISIKVGSHQTFYRLPLLKLMLESYFDISLAIFMQLHAVQLLGITQLVELPSDKANIALTMLFGLFTVCLPRLMHSTISSAISNNSVRAIKDTYGIFVEGTKTSSLSEARFHFWFVMRRLLSSLVLVFAEAYPYL